MRHAYYAAVSWLDHNLGTVLDALEGEGLKQETIVLLRKLHCPHWRRARLTLVARAQTAITVGSWASECSSDRGRCSLL